MVEKESHLAAALHAAYGLPEAKLRRVLGGQTTVNYAGTAGGRPVFAKQYLPGVDLHAEEAAIELSEFAAGHGVPTARVVRTISGSAIHPCGEAGFSVWEFVAGEPGGGVAMGSRRMAAVGHVVGGLHRVLAGHPMAQAVIGPAAVVCDVARSARRFERMLAEVSRASDPDEFLDWAADVLRWRLSIVPRVADMLAGLPPLTSQIVHGDLASPNVLFSGDDVAALIDFRPPRARPVAWELSRIG
ncbi:phosphotransferase enzyme family protein [Micromonospora sp. NPDC050397]|uniref:phosphotransferase enzyme family protein n=1 Tax=Micromonospora sp. NPDC050397 TaxID=3364279 RepID=UPI00384C25CB